MIKIKKSENADTRTCGEEISKSDLLMATYSHIKDVRKGCKFVSDKLMDAGNKHDHTKLDYFDEFYDNFSKGFKNEEFKVLGWYEKHLSERHHINDKIPENVNLIDVLEMVIDCCMAGLARSGEAYEIQIDPEVLMQAFKNTQKLIIENTEVEE